MFFIMGVSQGQKKLNFDQLVICGHCGRYGHLEVYMVYSYLSLFFIPVFKWGRRYYVRTTCCDTTVEISGDLGRQIDRGEVTSLPESIIPADYQYRGQGQPQGQTQGQAQPQGQAQTQPEVCAQAKKHCPSCGFETEEDYQFCPKCGQRL